MNSSMFARLADIRGFLALVARLIGRLGGRERWRPLRSVNVKGDSGGTGFGAGRTWELFSPLKGNHTAEKQADRLQVNPGGFLDLVAVIIEIAGIEAACWGVVV